MKVKDIKAKLNSFAHESLSREYIKTYSGYDNSGLLVGDENMEVTGVILTIDVTNDVIDLAISKGLNLIVSHHPFIYNSINCVTENSLKGSQIIRLIKNDIAVISEHLNLDVAEGGINDVFCQMLDGSEVEVMYPLSSGGMGRVFDIKEITLGELTNKVSEKLKDKTVFASGKESEKVSRIAAICGGGGDDSENLLTASKMGADCYISSDFKHHIIVLAGELGLNVISTSHYKMEEIILPKLLSLLGSLCDKIEIYLASPYI